MNEAIKSVSQPHTKVKVTPSDIIRFWRRVNKTENQDECWDWKTGKCRNGYGRFWIDGNTIGAHRASWIIHNGDIPEPINGYPLFVCHKCDNPSCVNPNHLFLGTTRDNVDDMLSKGRQLFGEKANASILKDAQVIEIRRLNRDFGYGKSKLSKMFGVGRSTIGWILKRHTWAHLP